MIILLFIFASTFALFSYGPYCYQFSCGSLIKNTNTPCVEVHKDSSQIILNQCDSSLSLYCNYFTYYSLNESLWKNTTCYYRTIPSQTCNQIKTQLTGDNCCTDVNCYSSNCINGKCFGLSPGRPCSVDRQCASDGYCNNKTCTLHQNYGDSCTSDLQCPVGGGCNFGICTQIFSLQLGAKAQYASFCYNNFIVDNRCEVLSIHLQDSAFKLYSPFLCVAGDVCVYTLSNGTVYHTSQCTCAGYYKLPEGFCGDLIQYVDGVMNVVYPKLMYDSTDCAGSNAHSSNPGVMYACASITKTQYNFYSNIYNQALYWNLYITGSLDDCAVAYGLWDPYFTSRNYLSLGLLLCPLFFLNLI